ncbi:MAG: tetraacyldisaccharide 4'-kinase [Verrucomicrobiales bacterium]
MKESLENLEQFAIDVILDRRKGTRAAMLRAVLFGLSGVYRQVINLRLFLYRNRILREHNLGCMVISIGNLTVGGTGKTPVVELFAKALQKGGRRVAILSRGYKSVKSPVQQRLKSRITGEKFQSPPRVVSDGNELLLDSKTAGDEPFMLASNLRDVAVVVDKDRVKAGRYAISELGADTLLLDDGLQYLKLRHRLDIVLIDRYAPFGNEYMLPRGTLREPPENLRRASYIFITKCDGGSNGELVKRIRKYNRTAEIIECRHRPLYLENMLTRKREPLEFLEGKYVGTVSGIAIPESFENGLRALGANVEVVRRYADHHRYSEKEIIDFINRCLHRDLDCIVTTEKDCVRFPHLQRTDVPIYFLRVEIEIISGHETWDACINRICQPRPAVPAGRFF